MLFSELYKMLVYKVTFLGFRGGSPAPIAPPLDPPLIAKSSEKQTRNIWFHKIRFRFDTFSDFSWRATGVHLKDIMTQKPAQHPEEYLSKNCEVLNVRRLYKNVWNKKNSVL